MIIYCKVYCPYKGVLPKRVSLLRASLLKRVLLREYYYQREYRLLVKYRLLSTRSDRR